MRVLRLACPAGWMPGIRGVFPHSSVFGMWIHHMTLTRIGASSW